MSKIVDAVMYPVMAALVVVGELWGMSFEDE